MAVLRDAPALGISLEEAERRIVPLITASRPTDIASSAISDMRIAIFGQSRVHYLAYARKLRAEYPFLDAEAWGLGRLAMLKLLASRNPMYFRKEFESAFAVRAGENMQAETALLLGDGGISEKGKDDGIRMQRQCDAEAGIEMDVSGALPGEGKD